MNTFALTSAAIFTLFFWIAILVVYTEMTAVAGRLLGIRPHQVAIGFFHPWWRTRVGDCDYTLSPFLLGASTSFHSEDDAEPCAAEQPRYMDLPARYRILLPLVGPASLIVLGIVLFSLPVVIGSPQLGVQSPTEVQPVGVSGLALVDDAASWRGQWNLITDLADEIGRTLVGLNESAECGGLISWALTVSALAQHSIWWYLAGLGLIALVMGVFNALPLPPLSGFVSLTTVAEAVVGRPLSPGVQLPFALAGLLMLLVLLVRLAWLDIRWFF